ncbi:MAG: Beta-ketoadipyl-CoA thiolase [Legionellaceae bacterium]
MTKATPQSNMNFRSVYIIDGARTPFLKARNKPGPFSAGDLATYAARALLARLPFEPKDLDEVITGCVMPSPDETNIGRVLALRLGCGYSVPGWTVQRNCASGLQAIDSAALNIAMGKSDLILAGGTDAMSKAPLLFNTKMVNWLSEWAGAKDVLSQLKIFSQFRLNFLSPIIALIRGLTDPIVGLTMGQTAENLAYRFGITREEMDTYAVKSHQRLAHALENHFLDEIVTIYDEMGNYFSQDDGLRQDSSIEKLATLKPIFDKPYGLVTAGNSSQVTDGAAFLILASAEAVKRYQLPVLGKIVDTHWASLNPAEMGLGPVHAITPLLLRHQYSLSDIDYFEINEAFSAQVLGCIKAWKDEKYCRENLNLTNVFGDLNEECLNVDGGAIAVGHPVGASGARIVLHLLHILKRNNAKRGIASLCIGGGQGGAMLIENVTGVEE